MAKQTSILQARFSSIVTAAFAGFFWICSDFFFDSLYFFRLFQVERWPVAEFIHHQSAFKVSVSVHSLNTAKFLIL